MSWCCDPMTPTRRAVLGAAGSLFAWSFAPKFVRAAGGRDMRFVVLVLRGGLDGLSAVAPVGDPAYAALREEIALSVGGAAPALPLDGFFALHPELPTLGRLFRAGQALVVHAVATGYRERSHFDGQDVLESGFDGPGRVESGWLNRMVGLLPRGDAVAPQGSGRTSLLGIGAIPPLLARGPAPVLGWAPEMIQSAGEDAAARLLKLYGETDSVFAQALSAGLAVDEIADRSVAMAGSKPGSSSPTDPRGMVLMAKGAASLLAAEDGPRIGALAFEGWDTHFNEGGVTGLLAKRLSGLDQAVATFERVLGPAWRDTVVLVVTEFGRTVRINGTVGTDHGTGTIAFLVGGAVRGGRVIADWPGLRDADLHEGRDLKPTVDLRSVAKGVLAEIYGLSGRQLADVVFPGSGSVRPLTGLIA